MAWSNSHRRFWLAPALVAILALLLSLQANQPSASAAEQAKDPKDAPELDAKTPEDFVAHEASDHSATVRSPKGWKDGKHDELMRIQLLIDDEGCSVNLIIMPNTNHLTLQQTRDEVPVRLKRAYPDVVVRQVDFVKIAGVPAVRAISEIKINGLPAKVCQFLILKNDQQYIFTYCTLIGEYEKHLKEVEQVVVSVSIK
jgi:hypothetical protein